MLRLRIDLYPHGSSRGKKNLVDGKIINDETGKLGLGNYNVLLIENGSAGEKTATIGRVEGHKRNDGVLKLFHSALKDLFEKRVSNCVDKGIYHWWIQYETYGGGWKVYKCNRCGAECKSRYYPPVKWNEDVYIPKEKR